MMSVLATHKLALQATANRLSASHLALMGGPYKRDTFNFVHEVYQYAVRDANFFSEPKPCPCTDSSVTYFTTMNALFLTMP